MSDVVDVVKLTTQEQSLSDGNDFNNTIQEVNDWIQILNAEYKKYIRYKLLLETVERLTETEAVLDDELKLKVSSIIVGDNIAQCTSIEATGCPGNVQVFGINKVDIKLTYLEKNQLKQCVNDALRDEYNSLSDGFFKLTGQRLEDVAKRTEDNALKLSEHDKVLIKLKRELRSEQVSYNENKLTYLKLLEDFTKLRVQDVPTVSERKVKENKVVADLNLVKTKLMKEKVQMDIFQENRISRTAYRELVRNIRSQQEAVSVEIEGLNCSKKLYQEVACKQYDEILKSYLEHKAFIEEKMSAFNILQK